MRITQGMINRRYQSQLNSAMERKNRSERKIQSTKRYNRASEDPISAAKALRVRQSLADVSDYMNNLATAEKIYYAADSTITNISEMLDTVAEQITYAANGTQSADEVEIVAANVDSLAQQIASHFNVDSGGRLIFGGTYNGDTAFAVQTEEATGRRYVTYNGVDVNAITDLDAITGAGVSYTDIGLGMYIDPETGRVEPQSALPVTINGAEVTGYGVDEKGNSQNIIQIILDAAQALKDGDRQLAMNLVDAMRTAQTKTSIAHAEIGNREAFIEYNRTRLTAMEEDLKSKQNEFEGTDMGYETTNWKTLTSIYNVSLQMATSVIPMSIFSFIS